MSAPQFLAVGHVVQDLVPGGWRLGGAVSFACVLAVRLGLRTAALTSASPQLDLAALLPGVEIACLPSERTTQFENIYDGPHRTQYVPSMGSPLTADALPAGWSDAAIAFLGPVVGEVEAALAHHFPSSLLGLSVQGWLREVGPDLRVRAVPPGAWDPPSLSSRDAALFVSDEDLPSGEAQAILANWSGLVPTLAFTRGEQGADVCHRGQWRHIDVFPAEAVEPTGAGDVFAAAFLIRLKEIGDVWEAVRFAACAGSLVVEGEGIDAVPDRDQIEARLAAHPEIVCRQAL